jgi:hypothetical protein
LCSPRWLCSKERVTNVYGVVPGIAYYVRPEVDVQLSRNPHALYRVEADVQQAYLMHLKKSCKAETAARTAALAAAPKGKNFKIEETRIKAQHPEPSCGELRRLSGA